MERRTRKTACLPFINQLESIDVKVHRKLVILHTKRDRGRGYANNQDNKDIDYHFCLQAKMTAKYNGLQYNDNNYAACRDSKIYKLHGIFMNIILVTMQGLLNFDSSHKQAE